MQMRLALACALVALAAATPAMSNETCSGTCSAPDEASSAPGDTAAPPTLDPHSKKLLHFPNNRTTVHEDGAAQLEADPNELLCVAFEGPSRAGKSFTANGVSGVPHGFVHNSTLQAVTAGIDVLQQVLPDGRRLTVLDAEGSGNALDAQTASEATSGGFARRHHSVVNPIGMLCAVVVYVARDFSAGNLREVEATAAAAATRLGRTAADRKPSLIYVHNMCHLMDASQDGGDPLARLLAAGSYPGIRDAFADVKYVQLPMRDARDPAPYDAKMAALRGDVLAAMERHSGAAGRVPLTGPTFVAALRRAAELVQDGDALPQEDLLSAALQQSVVAPLIEEYKALLPPADAWLASPPDPVAAVLLQLKERNLSPVLEARGKTMLQEACAQLYRERVAAIALHGRQIRTTIVQTRRIHHRTERYIAGWRRSCPIVCRKRPVWAHRPVSDGQTRSKVLYYNGTVAFSEPTPACIYKCDDPWADLE